MPRWVYCIIHILSSSLLFFILSIVVTLILVNYLYIDSQLIINIILLTIFSLISLISFFTTKKFSLWILKHKNNSKFIISLIILLILLNFICYLSPLLVFLRGGDFASSPPSPQPSPSLPPENPEFPKFPLPPPPASSTIVLSSSFFNEASNLSDIDKILTNALDYTGYLERSYFIVKDGFVIVTPLEKTNLDGTSVNSSERWQIGEVPLNFESFSIKNYFRVLLTADSGYYRTIIFIVNPHPFSQKGDQLTVDEARLLQKEGLNKLPSLIGQKAYSEDYTCTVLIYEFEKVNSLENVNTKIPGRLDAKTHLIKAGLLKKLEE